jgi:uncharacterized RDD family membrane protein YckC
MNTQDQYIKQVLQNIHATPADKARIEAELRDHFQAAQEAGEISDQAIGHLGKPAEVAEGYMAQIELDQVGFWPRLAAFAIDMLLILLTAAILAVISVALSSLVPAHPMSILDTLGGAFLILLIISCGIAALGLILLYFPILEGRFGVTLGKKLLGLRVLKENGLPIGYKGAFIRHISYFFEILPVDALFIPFTARKQRAFDIVARTLVVKDL